MICRWECQLLENVKNLVGHDQGKTFEVIKDTLTKGLNYSFIPFIINSKDYGNVPQTRERIYIVGFKNEGHIVASLNENVQSNLIHLFNDNLSTKFQIPKPISLTKKVTDIINKSVADESYYYNESSRYYSELKQKMTKEDTIYQWRRVYVRENKNKLCPTLTANMGTGGHNVPLVKVNGKYRKLTPQECLAFQGFDISEFKFPENMAKSHCYKQIGNSVVVPVIERIANNIKSVLS
ncbi:DNA (cytosine-5-)-methyltransferase [Cyanobacterium stanieri LEGE 03274]|uniref:DNA (cytosine-5-)-methyltransferase n=1 Tax=Cyanobacterium stanieri LEGE 03274 TaxID=1828756 RepID=A0ABR9V7H8_9CHRO|nr:DNA (cytosine-5-)-methyltransferase [Cyanobacterium stanieri]MBE9223850.1 DNA (cytosine-5-)-methyltransferase [Cyanobacterium stanieri LEGE 03274]